VWKYEDLDTALVRPMSPTDYLFDDLPFSFDIGPNDIMGVVGLGRLAQRRDSGWSSEQLPMPMTDMALSYDTASRPSLTFKDSLWRGCLGLKTDSSWDTDMVYIPDGNTIWYSLTRPAWRRNGNCALIEADVWSMGGLIDGYGVSFKRRDGGIWTDFGGAGGLDGGGHGFAALADISDSIHTFWSAADNYFTNKLVCDADSLDTYTSIGAACLDDYGRVQCTWILAGLKFAVPGCETWIVQDTGNAAWCDITTDKLNQPIIAFCRRDGSVWVARGVGVVGLSDEPRGAAVHPLEPGATIVRGVLFLPKMGTVPSGTAPVFGPSLLDACGRCVMDLHPGANDVRALAPGVYFIRRLKTEDGRPATDVRRVVIVK